MTDVLNQIFQAWSERIRSPILGSIALAFFAINWKPLYYLLFAETSVLTRITYFDMKTDWVKLFWGPLFVGLLFAALTPWITFLGTWMARLPKRQIFRLQEVEASNRRISSISLTAQEERAKAELQQVQEQRAIDAAKRLEEAKVVGEDVSNAIQETRETEEIKNPLPLWEVHGLSDSQKIVLKTLAVNDHTPMTSRDITSIQSVSDAIGKGIPKTSERRILMEVNDSIHTLLTKKGHA